MKQNVLRRLSALFLALAMAASLCVTPAWADDPDVTDPDNPPVTPADPSPDDFKLDTELVILPQSSQSYTLGVSGVPTGKYVRWTASGGASVSQAITEGDADQTSSVTVNATSNAAPGKVEVRVYNDPDCINDPYSQVLTCYVYGGGRTPLVLPDTLPEVTVGPQYSQTLTFGYDRDTAPQEVKDIFDRVGGITVQSVPADYADAAVVSAGDSGFRITITGKRTGKASLRMTMPGGFTKLLDLTIKAAPGTVPVDFLGFPGVPSSISLTVGETYTMAEPTISPSSATNKNIKWTSSPEGIVTLDEKGNITAVKQGTATVTAEAENPGNAQPVKFTVKVTDAPFSFKVAPQEGYTSVIDLRTGPKTTRIQATKAGLNSSKAKITRWTSSNPNVAALNSPDSTANTVVITGKANGTANITAYVTYTDANGTSRNTSAYCTVTVLDDKSVEITSITLSEKTHTMPADGSFKLTASLAPANALVKTVEWDSSNKAVATVDENGNVKAEGAGEAIIIAKALYGNNLSTYCTVTVTPIAETITLNFPFTENSPVGSNKYKYTFPSGIDYFNVRAILGPTGASDPIHWYSKETSIATVTNTTGTQVAVRGVGPGKTTIYAVPMDPAGKDRVLDAGPAEIEVTVSGIGLDRTSLTLMQGRRETLVATAYGSANNGNSSCEWTSSDPSVVSVGSKTGESTALTARSKGTAVITATKGSYTATCNVTVTEDTAGVIDGISTTPGTAYQFSSLVSKLQAACTAKTGASLSYITNLSVSSTDQGILHDQHHSSADTGAGVGIQDKYYPGTAPQGQRSLSDLSFVPKTTFSGLAEINYTAWSTDNQSVSGVIRINVNGTGDVMYSSGDGSPVTFSADDFNFYHPNLRSVSFTLPLESRGTLYYGYTSASQPGTKVTASDTYNRTGTPSLDRVTFVPASGYTGTVSISYRGTDTAGRAITGTVTINVGSEGQTSSPGDIYYPMTQDSWTTFKPADFSAACRAVLGETLSYVRFNLPASSDGTLFYNYRGFGNYDSDVASTTSYYYSGTPSLGGVSFVPTTTTPGQVDITYTGYSTRGNTFTGTIHIGMDDPGQQGGLRYTVFTGKSVSFNASDFNTACVAATGASLNYVMFSPLPAVAEGTLRYTRTNSTTTYNLATTTRCYRSTSSTMDVQLNYVSFLASTTFTGTVTIPFTGYNTNGVSFTGEVIISVTPPTTGDSVYSGTTASPIRLSSSRMRSLCSGVLDRDLSYITFTSLPSSTAGRLYLGYSNFNNSGTQVNTGTRYYVSSSPSIDQISFVPRGRYSGQVSVGYTATDTSGKSVSGLLTFSITNTANSTYFNDMGGHTWAGPAVDYLYQNGVTNGVTSTTFGPDQHILRCDFVLMLCRAFHFTGGSGYSFADVPTNAYYANAVATAKQLGIVNGDGVNFMPNSELTRQDAMVMIKNALDVAGWNVTSASTSILGRFPDGTSVSSYARDAVSTLVNMGAVTGDNGMLYPFNSITRAEAAVILHFVMTM